MADFSSLESKPYQYNNTFLKSVSNEVGGAWCQLADLWSPEATADCGNPPCISAALFPDPATWCLTRVVALQPISNISYRQVL